MYSTDFRVLALRWFSKARSYWQAARDIGISSSTLHRWVAEGPPFLRNAPATAKKLQATHRNAALDRAIQTELTRCAGSTTLWRLQSCLQKAHGVSSSTKAIARAVKRLGFARKRVSGRFSGTAAPERVSQFCEDFQRYKEAGCLIVSTDESYFSEKVIPHYGYSRTGVKCTIRAPSSWKQRSLLSAVASDGTSCHHVQMGTVNQKVFSRFILSLPYPPGTVVMLDNASIHKAAMPFVAKGYRALFTPPYSPWFNPVEGVFSVAKTAFRAMWPWQSGVDACIRAAVDGVAPACILGNFRHVQKLTLEHRIAAASALAVTGGTRAA